jgi:hypothetical protein
MKWNVRFPKNSKLIALSVLTTLVFTTSTDALAKHRHHGKKYRCSQRGVYYKNADMMPIQAVDMFMPHWYVGGHIGVSRAHDKASAGSGNSVTQIGPAWTADIGYKFLEYRRAVLAAELGFNQYHDSNETTPGTNVASTQHFATYLAAVLEYPLGSYFEVMGKLGGAYGYAKKVFTATGTSASANDVSPFYGLGVAYHMTSKADLVLQWNRVRGDSSTGSTDMTSLGVTYNFI